MTDRGAFDGIGLLIVDGNNLLHRVAGAADSRALRPLLARLRSTLPPDLPTTLMLDGHPAAGTSRVERVSHNLQLRHAGSISADDAIVYVIRDQPVGERYGVTVVTDDRSLTERARRLGAKTQRLAWLEHLVGGATASGIGRPSISRPSISRPKVGGQPSPPAGAAEDERESWKPGRGATRKRGNPRRGRSQRS